MILDLKILSAYLPYRLNFLRYEKLCLDSSVTPVIWSTDLHPVKTQLNAVTLNNFDYATSKLILRPLSELEKEIEHNGVKVIVQNQINDIKRFVDVFRYNGLDYDIELNIETSDYSVNVDLYDGYKIVKKLLEYHFDVFGLIEKGLAVDINTLS